MTDFPSTLLLDLWTLTHSLHLFELHCNCCIRYNIFHIGRFFENTFLSPLYLRAQIHDRNLTQNFHTWSTFFFNQTDIKISPSTYFFQKKNPDKWLVLQIEGFDPSDYVKIWPMTKVSSCLKFMSAQRKIFYIKWIQLANVPVMNFPSTLTAWPLNFDPQPRLVWPPV